MAYRSSFHWTWSGIGNDPAAPMQRSTLEWMTLAMTMVRGLPQVQWDLYCTGSATVLRGRRVLTLPDEVREPNTRGSGSTVKETV